MPTATKVCKVCGKVYPYCKTNRPVGLFRWQDVACSEECGAEYFKRIALSRGELVEEAPAEEVAPEATIEQEVSEPVEEVTEPKATTKQRRKKNKE